MCNKAWWLILALAVVTHAIEPESSSDATLSQLRHDDERVWQMRTVSGTRENLPDPLDDNQGYSDDPSDTFITRPRRRRRKRIHPRPAADEISTAIADYDDYVQETAYREKPLRQIQTSYREAETGEDEHRPYRTRPRRRRLKPRRRRPQHELIDDSYANTDIVDEDQVPWDNDNRYHQDNTYEPEFRRRRYRPREHHAQEDTSAVLTRTGTKHGRVNEPEFELYEVNHNTDTSENRKKLYSNERDSHASRPEKDTDEKLLLRNSELYPPISFNPDRHHEESETYKPIHVRIHKPYTLPPTYVSQPADYIMKTSTSTIRTPSLKYNDNSNKNNINETNDRIDSLSTTENIKTEMITQAVLDDHHSNIEDLSERPKIFRPTKARRKQPSMFSISSNEHLTSLPLETEITNKIFEDTTEVKISKINTNTDNDFKHPEKAESQELDSIHNVFKSLNNSWKNDLSKPVFEVKNKTTHTDENMNAGDTHHEYDDYSDTTSASTAKSLSPHLLVPRKRPLIPLRFQESPNIDPMKQEENTTLPYVHRELSKYAPKHRTSLARTYNRTKEVIEELPQSPIPTLPPVKIQYEVKSIEELIQKTRESLQMRFTSTRPTYSSRIKQNKDDSNEPMRISIDMDSTNTTNNSTTTTTEVFGIEDEILELLRSANSSATLARVLASRNMTLSDLIEHRERGSSKHHLADIFKGNNTNETSSQNNNSSTHQNTKNEQSAILNSTRDILHLLENLTKNESDFHVVNNVNNITKENEIHTTSNESKEAPSNPLTRSKLPSSLAKLFETNTRRKSRIFDQNQPPKDDTSNVNDEIASVIQKPAPYPIPIWVPVTFPPHVGLKPYNVSQNSEVNKNEKSATEDTIVLETTGKVHKMGDKGGFDINKLHDEDYDEDYRNPDTNSDYGYEELPSAMKSAIIASSAILILTILIFLFIFVGCRWRQRRARRRFINGILSSRPRSPIFDDHSQIEDKCVINSRSLTPVLVNSTDLYKTPSEMRTSSRNYYLWNTVRKTLRYK